MKYFKGLFLLLMIASVMISCTSTTEVVETVEPQKTLHELIIEGRTDEVQAMFQTETDINEVDANGNTALHAAASINNVDIVNLLLFRGADSEIKNFEGDTPLHLAIKNKGNESAALLGNIGNNVFSRDGQGQTAFELALKTSVAITEVLITEHTGSLQDVQGYSIVHYLVMSRNIQGVEYAIANNISLSLTDSKGQSPLSLAYSQKDYESVEIAAKLLLGNAAPERGTYSFFEDSVKMRNPSLRFDEGQTPLHLAVILGEQYIAEYVINQGAAVDAKDSSGATALHEAVRQGHVDIVYKLLSAGADVNTQDSMGKTPLLIITPENTQGEIYEALLSNGANINATDSFGDTALHIASLTESKIEILEYLVTRGADINERNKQGVTPLAQAVEKRLAEHIEYYAEQGADIHAADINSITPLYRSLDAGLEMTKQLINIQNISLRDSMGNTALHIAIAKNSSLDQITFLIDMGIDVNARNRNGHSALYLAVQDNNRSIGEKLLSSGADVFSTDSENSSPLRLALTWGADVEDWVLTSEVIIAQDGAGNTPLHYASEWNLNESLISLLEKGSDPNSQNNNGESPIYNAVKADNIDGMRILLESGTDRNLRNYLGDTVVHYSVRWNAQDAARLAVENGYDVNAKNLSGKTALHQAARSGNNDMILLLLEVGANIHAADTAGRTPLMDAIQAENISNVKLLIANGASASIPEMYGRNAYHEAVETGNIELIRVINEAGGNPLARDTHGRTPLSLVLDKSITLVEAVLSGDVHLTDSDGNTPLHIAVINTTSDEVLQYLITQGYSPDRRNSEGKTPLLMATQKGALAIVEEFLLVGADPFIMDNSGESALSFAIGNNPEMLNLIVQLAGTKRDIAGETILHYAAREADYETVQRLISMGLDKTIKNISGETAYDIALRWDQDEVATLLK